MSDRAIIEAITKMTGLHKLDPVYYVNAIVESVDLLSRTCVCTAIDGHTEYELPGVKLMAVVDDGLLIEPVIGSTVKVIFSQLVEPFICQYSEIQNITIVAIDKISFNDGLFGGLIKVADLVSKLNALENKLNALLTAYNMHVHVSNGTPTVSIVAGILTPTLRQDLENTKIIHGI